MTVKLGVLTIGEAPRPDALTKEMQATLGPQFELVERGALDGLTEAEIAALAPDPDQYLLITLRAGGQSVRLSKPNILPLVQRQIDRLEQEDGVTGILLMCTGTFPAFRHTGLLLKPQQALYQAVLGLADGGRPASLVPLLPQVEQTRRKWAEFGTDAVVVPANPYGENPTGEIVAAARQAREAGATVLFMDCFGFTLAMKETARQAFGGPVVLARSMAARLLAEVTA
jgi:protein AroM